MIKMILNLFIYFIGLVVLSIINISSNNTVYTLTYIFIYLAIFLALYFINNLDYKKKITKEDLKYTAIYLITGCILIVITTTIIKRFAPIPGNQTSILESIEDNPIVAFISLLVYAPIIEEIIFRYGFSFIKNKYLYLIFSSIPFALLHLSSGGNFFYLIPYTIIGLIMGLTYYRSKNLLLSTLTHSSYNLIAFIVTIIGGLL